MTHIPSSGVQTSQHWHAEAYTSSALQQIQASAQPVSSSCSHYTLTGEVTVLAFCNSSVCHWVLKVVTMVSWLAIMSAQAAHSLKKSPVPVAYGTKLHAGAVGKLPLLGKGSYAYNPSVIHETIYSTHICSQFTQPHGTHGSALLLTHGSTAQRLCLRLQFLKYCITCSRTVRPKGCLL